MVLSGLHVIYMPPCDAPCPNACSAAYLITLSITHSLCLTPSKLYSCSLRSCKVARMCCGPRKHAGELLMPAKLLNGLVTDRAAQHAPHSQMCKVASRRGQHVMHIFNCIHFMVLHQVPPH